MTEIFKMMNKEAFSVMDQAHCLKNSLYSRPRFFKRGLLWAKVWCLLAVLTFHLQSARAQQDCNFFKNPMPAGGKEFSGSCAASPQNKNPDAGKVTVVYKLTVDEALKANPKYPTKPYPFGIVVLFNWADGNSEELPLSAMTMTTDSDGKVKYEITRDHIYRGNTECYYNSTARITYKGYTPCGLGISQNQAFNVMNVEGISNSGGNMVLLSPQNKPNYHYVCAGEDIDVIFDDVTTTNCNEAKVGSSGQQNMENRWQHILYNTTASSTKIPNAWVVINEAQALEVQLTEADGGNKGETPYVDPRGIWFMPAPTGFGWQVRDDPSRKYPRRDALRIKAKGGFGEGFPKAGDSLTLTLRYWNVCNPYSDNPDNPKTPKNGDYVNGDNIPSEKKAIIKIISAPPAPVPIEKTICNGETLPDFEITVEEDLGVSKVEWYADNNNLPDLENPHFTSTTRIVASDFNIDNYDAGIHKIWVRYYADVSGLRTCASDWAICNLVIREALQAPDLSSITIVSPLAGVAEVCRTSQFKLSTAEDPGSTTIGGTAKFVWTPESPMELSSVEDGTKTATFDPKIPPGWTAASFDKRVSVKRVYADDKCATAQVEYPIKIHNDSQAGTITTTKTDYCSGAEVNKIKIVDATRIKGLVEGWEVSTNNGTNYTAAGLGTDTEISPGTLQAGNYWYRLKVVNGLCAAAYSNVIKLAISANTEVAAIETGTVITPGSNDKILHLCGDTSVKITGSDPSPGTGKWEIEVLPSTATPGEVSLTPLTTPTTMLNITRAANAGKYKLKWTVTSGTCETNASITIIFGASPSPNAGGDQVFCGTSGILDATLNASQEGTWTINGGCTGPCPVIFSSSNTSYTDNPENDPKATVTLTGPYAGYDLEWTVTSGSCTPQSVSKKVTFNQPASTEVMTDFIACVNPAAPGDIPITGIISGGTTLGQWEIANGSGTFGSTGPNGTYIPSMADLNKGSVILKLVSDDPDDTGPCSAAESDPVTITFDNKPADAVAGNDQETCDIAPLNATAPTNGGIGTWSTGGVLYYESFSFVDNGTGVIQDKRVLPASGNWTMFFTSPSKLASANDYVKVVAGKLEARNTGSWVWWKSREIQISRAGEVEIYADFEKDQSMDATRGESIEIFYMINGEAIDLSVYESVIFDDKSLRDIEGSLLNTVAPFKKQVKSLPIPVGLGDKIEIFVKVRSTNSASKVYMDNVMLVEKGISPVVFSDVNSPTATVSGLKAGDNVLRWTVSSKLGQCIATSDEVTIKRNPLPYINKNFTPQLCERLDSPEGVDAAGPVDLAEYEDEITGGVTGLDIKWFKSYLMDNNSAIVDINSYTGIVNESRLWVKLTDAVGCSSNTPVIFTVNPHPEVRQLNDDLTTKIFCEDVVGDGTSDNINLSQYTGEIIDNPESYSFTWYSDNPLVTEVTDPDDIDDVSSTYFYAEVTNPLTTCSNIAEVSIYVAEKPEAQTIKGESIVCAGSGSQLYGIVKNDGATYRWTIPDDFETVDGGESDDNRFNYALLRFPEGSSTNEIAVTEISRYGCEGDPISLSIQVDSGPPTLTIEGESSVCEGQKDVTYSVSSSSTAAATYTWTAEQSSIIEATGNGLKLDFDANISSNTVNIHVKSAASVGCSGGEADLTVTISKKPDLADDLINTVCSDAEAGITLRVDPSSEPARDYNITAGSIDPGLIGTQTTGTGLTDNALYDNQFENKTSEALPVIYQVVPVSEEGCLGDREIVMLYVKPKPWLAEILNLNYCSGLRLEELELGSAAGSASAEDYYINAIYSNGLSAGTENISAGETITPFGLMDEQWENTSGNPITVEYQVRPSNGCLGNVSSVKVTINPEPVVQAVTEGNVICSGNTPGFTLTANLTVTDENFYWKVYNKSPDIVITGNGTAGGTGSQIDDIIKNDQPGLGGEVTYEITATGPGDCQSDPAYVIITVDPAPEANTINPKICSTDPGGSTAVADLSEAQQYINNTPGVSFTWTREMIGGKPDFTNPIETGRITAYPLDEDNKLFYVKVEGQTSSAAGKCSSIAQVVYNINPVPVIDAQAILKPDGTYHVSCTNGQDGEIHVSANGSSSSYQFSNDGGDNYKSSADGTYSFTSLAAGSYQIVVKDAQCANTMTVDLVAPLSKVQSTSSSKDVTCFFGQDGAIFINASGGVGEYTYVIKENSAKVWENGSFEGLSAGKYTVVITDRNGCREEPSIVIEEPSSRVEISNASVRVDGNGYALTCSDASDATVELEASGGDAAKYTFRLYKEEGVNDLLVKEAQTSSPKTSIAGLSAGNYRAELKDNAGCAASPARIAIDQQMIPLVLDGGIIGDPDGNQSYFLCKDQGDPVVIEESVAASGGVKDYQYRWYKKTRFDSEPVLIEFAQSNTYSPSVVSQTTDFIRMVKSGSCDWVASNTITVTVQDIPSYTFEVEGAIGPHYAKCEGESFSLKTNIIGANAGSDYYTYTYSIDDGVSVRRVDAGSSAEHTLNVTNFEKETTYTFLTATDLYGCELKANDARTIKIIRIDPEFRITGAGAGCSGSEFAFEWEVDNGVNYTWTWSDGTPDTDLRAGNAKGNITHTFENGSTLSSENYLVTLVASNDQCGQQEYSKTIEVYPAIKVNVQPDEAIICGGNKVTFANNSLGATAHEWRVAGSGGAPVTEPEASYVFSDQGQNPVGYEVIYTGSNNYGCSSSQSTPITVYGNVNAAFTMTPDPPGPFTAGRSEITFTNTSSVFVNGSADIDYAWSFGGPEASPNSSIDAGPITVSYRTGGTKEVVLRVTNRKAFLEANKDCVSEFSKSFTIPVPPLTAKFSASPLAACAPAEVKATNESLGADIFRWKLIDEGAVVVQESSDTDPVFTINHPGRYKVVLESEYSPTMEKHSAQKDIEVLFNPNAYFDGWPKTFNVPDVVLNIVNYSVDAQLYEWQFGDGETSTAFEPIHYYKAPGDYKIVLQAGYDHGDKDSDGDGITDGNIVCYDTASQVVHGNDGSKVSIPNAFTPNLNGPNSGSGNGDFNDVFLPETSGVVNFHMEIYDRWGSLIFESKDKTRGWNGYDRRGNLLPAGIYVYKITIGLSDGRTTTDLGDIALIR